MINIPSPPKLIAVLLLAFPCSHAFDDAAFAQEDTTTAVSEPTSEMEGYAIPEDPIFAEIIEHGEAAIETDSPAYATPGPALEAELPAPVEAVSPAAPEIEYVDYSVGPADTSLQPEVSTVNGSNRITINLDSVSLEDTVRMFGQTTGANIIAAPNLFTGKYVTVSLNDVDWIPALRSILEIHNFTLVERTPGAGVFTVTPRGADTPDPTQIRTFFLDYTTAGEVHDSVEKMLQPGRTNEIRALKFDSRNAIIVRSTESNLGELEALVKELDRPGKQILIEAKILELSDEASKQLGIKWDSLEAFGVRAGLGPFTRRETTVDTSSSRNNRDFSDNRFSVDSSRQFRDASGNIIPNNIAQSQNNALNQSSSQNQGNSFNQSQSANDSFEVGPSSSSSSSGQNSSLGQNSSSAQSLSSGQSSSLNQNTTPVIIGNPNPGVFQRGDGSSFLGSGTGYIPGREQFNYSGSYDGNQQGLLDTFTRTIVQEQSAILEMDSLQIILSALEKTDGVSVVSNPKMIVNSGATNSFFRVGEREPIVQKRVIKGTEQSPGDTIVANLDTEIQTDFIRGGYLETGIDLGVIATVKTDDFIEAYIRPVLRRMIGQKIVEGNSWPIISVKEIGTGFTLRSGQTIAIGGLTDSQEVKETTRVPVLGSLPVLGRLFSHTRDVKRQVETIIFVTLSIADPVSLEKSAGIPEDARLVHNRLLQQEALAAQRAAETNELDKADSGHDKPKRKKSGKK